MIKNLKGKLKLYKIYNSIISILLVIALLMLINSYSSINNYRAILINEDNISENNNVGYLEMISDLDSKINIYGDQIDEMATQINILHDLMNKPDTSIISNDDNTEIIIEDSTAHLILYEITSASGLTVDDYLTILKNLEFDENLIPWHENIANGIYLYENEYNVNGIFILSVIMRMTNLGLNSGLIKANNLFGITKSDHRTYRIFDKPEDSIKYFTELINIHYFKKGFDTIQLVSEKYIPRISASWADDIILNINMISDVINNDIVMYDN